MGFLGFGNKKEEINEEYTPTIGINEIDLALNTAKKAASFKGEVEKKERTFPVGLGEEHPFDFCITEGIFSTFGLVNGIIDKYLDFVVGPGFFVESEDEQAKKIIEDFMKDVNFDTILRAWVKESLIKGNGFLEIGGKKDESPKGLKVLNANYMYVKRDKFGVIEDYNQYTGGFKRFDKTKVIPFKPYQIAHIPLNLVGDNAYGYGIIAPSLIRINKFLGGDKDMHVMSKRKANSPLQIKMGGVVGGKYMKAKQADIDKVGREIETLTNKTEWVTDGLTEMKVIDFGNVGDKFAGILQHDLEMLLYGFQVPSVLMGKANVAEGLAKVQMDAFQRRITSLQLEIEKVIENDLFKRILLANGIDEHVEFQWGQASNLEKINRLTLLTTLMKVPKMSDSLQALMEKDAVKLLNYDEKEYEELMVEEEKRKEEERKAEEARQQPIIPGQNAVPPKTAPKLPPKPKPVVKQHYESCDCGICESGILDESFFGKFNTISEWLGFNYKQFIKEIKDIIKQDKFDLLAAKNKIEESAGLLTDVQVVELKKVLDNGFTKGQSITEIAKGIDKKVSPKDLLKFNSAGLIKTAGGLPIVVKESKDRSIMIARTEVSRMANDGAIEHFKKGGVSRIKWIASAGPRTCPDCMALDNQIFEIDSHPDIPLHVMCRCTTVPITELG